MENKVYFKTDFDTKRNVFFGYRPYRDLKFTEIYISAYWSKFHRSIELIRSGTIKNLLTALVKSSYITGRETYPVIEVRCTGNGLATFSVSMFDAYRGKGALYKCSDMIFNTVDLTGFNGACNTEIENLMSFLRAFFIKVKKSGKDTFCNAFVSKKWIGDIKSVGKVATEWERGSLLNGRVFSLEGEIPLSNDGFFFVKEGVTLY